MVDDEDRLVAGRYRLLRRVGDGAMGVVWQAVDERLDRAVAVKQLRLAPGLSPDEARQARQRVFREARIAARLQHPHAVVVYDVADDDDGRPWLVMEYVPSRSLAALLEARGVLPPEQAAGIGAQAASALAAAHAAGIVHRDVKPGNILLDEHGTAKITDFGISHATGDVTVTRTGLLAGTPAFLSPEAARGEPPGQPSDVFSLGATLYTAVEGTPPFGDSDNPIALLHRVAAGQAPPPRQAGPLAEPLLNMLRDDPAARPAMADVAERLSAIAAGQRPTDGGAAPVAMPARTRLDLQPLSATPSPTSQPGDAAGLSGLSRRTTYTLLGVLAAGLVALLVATLLTTNRPGGAASPATTSQPPTSSPVSPGRLQQAVADYYALLPDDTDQAWVRLGPDLRTQDRERYEKFWKDVKDLRVVTPPQVSGSTVVVEIEYTVESRGRVRETHQHDMLVQNGTVLINSDQVLSSRTTGGDEKKGGKKDKEEDGEGGGN